MQQASRPGNGSVTRLTARLKPGNQVRCVDCGYLNLVDLSALWGRLQTAPGRQPEADDEAQGREIFLADRNKIRFRRFKNVAGLSCYRHVPFYEAESDETLRREELDKRMYDGALAPRQCEYYQQYQPGLPPQDHMLLQLQPGTPVEKPRLDFEYWLMVVSLCLASFFAGLVTRPIWEGLLAAVLGVR